MAKLCVEIFMASSFTVKGLIMVDLSEVPLNDLKDELKRRIAAAREAKEKEMAERHCCKNCAYRFLGHINYGKIQGGESWVCYKKPKKFKTYFNDGPQYNQAYFACSPVIKGCEMFVHKNSPKGAKIKQKISSMANRMS